MHLVRGMTSLNTKKRKHKNAPGIKKALEEHNKWLRKMGVHPDQLKTKEKSSGASIPDYAETRSGIKTSDVITRIAGKNKSNTYSGEYIIGLATLHKSNTVPVGRGDNPEIYAKMRRG
jgi:Tat protein secretion system quality control protein TatD with DNase activity